jgi:Fe-S cluster assembly protein SufB
MAVADLDLGRYKLGWSDDLEYVFKPEKGLSADVVDQMSWWKGEPEWMRQVRLRSLRMFERKPMATNNSVLRSEVQNTLSLSISW